MSERKIIQYNNRTYPVGDSAAHTSDESHAASGPQPDHLARNRLSGHEHTRHVDFEHRVGVLGAVLESWSFLLDARGGKQAVQAAMGVGDLLDNVVQKLDVSHIDATVVQLSAQFLDGTLLNPGEIRRLDRPVSQ